MGSLQQPDILLFAQLFLGAAKQSSLDFEILDPAIVPSQKREEFVKCGEFPIDGHRFTPYPAEVLFPFRDTFPAYFPVFQPYEEILYIP